MDCIFCKLDKKDIYEFKFQYVCLRCLNQLRNIHFFKKPMINNK